MDTDAAAVTPWGDWIASLPVVNGRPVRPPVSPEFMWSEWYSRFFADYRERIENGDCDE